MAALAPWNRVQAPGRKTVLRQRIHAEVIAELGRITEVQRQRDIRRAVAGCICPERHQSAQRRLQTAVLPKRDRCCARNRRAVDLHLCIPDVGCCVLNEVHRCRVCRSQRVVHGHRGRVVEAGRIGRIENRVHRLRCVRRQVDAKLCPRGGLWRICAGRELQVLRRAGVEQSAARKRVRLQPRALGVDDEALVVHPECTRARVGACAAVAEYEKALPANRKVERVVGKIDVALRELLGNGRQPDTAA